MWLISEEKLWSDCLEWGSEGDWWWETPPSAISSRLLSDEASTHLDTPTYDTASALHNYILNNFFSGSLSVKQLILPVWEVWLKSISVLRKVSISYNELLSFLCVYWNLKQEQNRLQNRSVWLRTDLENKIYQKVNINITGWRINMSSLSLFKSVVVVYV